MMKTKPLVIGAVSAAIAGFLLGFIWYGIVFEDWYKTEFSTMLDKGEDMNLPLLFAGFLVFAFVQAALFDKWSGGQFAAANGFKFGAILGLIPGLGMAMISFSTTRLLSTTGVLLDASWGIVCFGLMGMIIAFVYGKFQPMGR